MAVAPVSGMCIMAWAMSSIQPANKRAVGIALINALSQLALVAGPYVYTHLPILNATYPFLELRLGTHGIRVGVHHTPDPSGFA